MTPYEIIKETLLELIRLRIRHDDAFLEMYEDVKNNLYDELTLQKLVTTLTAFDDPK